MFIKKAALYALLFASVSVHLTVKAEDEHHSEPDLDPDTDDGGSADVYIVKVNSGASHPIIGASVESKFHQWSLDHGKKYHTEAEKKLRLQNWLTSDSKIRNHNKNYDAGQSKYWMKHNEFSDMTPEEFAAHFNLYSYVEDPIQQINGIMNAEEKDNFMKQVNNLRAGKRGMRELQDDVDWTNAGMVTDVKNQQSCGSCWAFAAAAGMESSRALYMTENGLDGEILVDLSEQEMVDCADSSTGNYGCSGGWPKNAIAKYVKKQGGICSEADYPYENTDTNGCRSCAEKVPYTAFTKSKYIYKISQNIRDASLVMAANAVEPLMVAVIAEPYADWMLYGGGIFDNEACGDDENTAVNHAMLLTGYSTGDGYFRFKNSWGAGWGDSGYINLPLDANLKDNDGPCGMLRYVMNASL